MASVAEQGLPPIPPNISIIVGPAFFAHIANWFLEGILIMQIYIYYQWFPDDKRMIKCLVYSLFILDTLQACLGTSDGFYWFAIGFGNMNIVTKPHISAFDAPILDGIIALIVQTFFCWRIKVLQKSWWLPLVIFTVSLAGFIGALASGYKTFQSNDLSKLGLFKWEFSLWLASSALADTLIAIVMTFVLLRSRSKTYEQTNNVLVKIVRLTVETNIITASLAVLSLVVLLAIPQFPNITMTPGFALGKSYTNTLLAILNNRIYMKRGTSPITSTLNYRHPVQQSIREGQNTQVGAQLNGEEYTLDISVHPNVEAKASKFSAI